MTETSPQRTLLEALAARPELAGGATVLVYAGAACQFARWADGALDFGPGSRLTAEANYEARAFNDQGELRWRDGDAVWLPPAIEDLTPLARPATYLLWGPATGEHDGPWSEFTTARTGPFWLPVAGAGKTDYATLTAVEYTAEDEHGNVRVVEERLVGLGV